MKRENISSGVKWEPVVGYSRAVEVGPHVHVAGTVATGADGHLIETSDSREQTIRAIKTALRTQRAAAERS